MTKKTNLTMDKVRSVILDAARRKVEELDLNNRGITTLPPEIGLLTHLRRLKISNSYGTEPKNHIISLPAEIKELRNLSELDLSKNGLTALPKNLGELKSLSSLDASENNLQSLPEDFGQLNQLTEVTLYGNDFTSFPAELFQLRKLESINLARNPIPLIPSAIDKLKKLQVFIMGGCPLNELPDELYGLKNMRMLWLLGCQFSFIPLGIFQLRTLRRFSIGSSVESVPAEIGLLTELRELNLSGNNLVSIPAEIGNLSNLVELEFGRYGRGNKLQKIPAEVGRLSKLKKLALENNELRFLPASLADIDTLQEIYLDQNPLDPIIKSVYEQGLPELMSYLRGLKESRPLYEAKLVLLGEGGVGKTTLLKALSGKEPRQGEPTTHGINIDVHSMHLPHPEKPDVQIQLNAWDFGGQEVYRVTHQFFFSRRSIYLLVWEPRLGVQQSQVDDWLKLIRLRVGDDAKVIIVSTHAKTGQRIARIDKPVFRQNYGSMIVDFKEVDSLTDDPDTNDKFGIAELKSLIAEAAKDLEQMGSPFNINWRAARDELIELGQTQPFVSYSRLSEVCSTHKLDEIDTRTLAGLMHDLGYIVFYGDDERLQGDVVLQPEWLTKAIGFVLEDRKTQECEGVLADNRLEDVWLNHPFENEPRYDPTLYPFFLRLMEKYDVSYRLDEGNASLVAQHVPQVRPGLPWLPEEEPKEDLRRLAMIYEMEDVPPGLVPWMIVRTHQYAFEQNGHRLHWQKGMFLRNTRHGEAMLELRGREFHLYAEAVWPEYFMNILLEILKKLISDNWPGLEGRHSFNVPCLHKTDGQPCQGRFEISALRQFLEEGDKTYRCQTCRTNQKIVDLLFGFEDEEPRAQLQRIEEKIDLGFAELESRLANYVMAIMRAMANEAKDGPRLFDIQPVNGNWKRIFEEKYQLRLWCEAEGNQHPVLDPDRGSYEFEATREWVKQVAPYANFIAGLLKTLVPVIAPGVNLLYGEKTIEKLGLGSQLDLMKEATKQLQGEMRISDPRDLRKGVLNEDERSGLLALHSLLRELDPQHARLGLRRVPTYTGDYQWLCETHYNLVQPRIPEVIG